MKKILSLLLFLIIATSLFACGGEEAPCEEHKDENKDGICDLCSEKIEEEEEEEVPEGTLLIQNGEIKFAFVLAKEISTEARVAIEEIGEELLGAELFTLGREEGFDTYIYVGVELGEIFDGYTLGTSGYTVSDLDGNIVVSAGSEEKLLSAISHLKKKLFDKWDGESALAFTDKHAVTEETRYRTEIFVGSTPLSDYVIVADENSTAKAIAETLAETFYQRAGAKLKIVSESDGPKIVVKLVDEIISGGFRVYEKDGDIIFECAYEKRFAESVEKFITEKIVPGTLDFKKLSYSLSIETIYYEEFGAVGDGKTDDFEAIKAAHEYANENGHKVKAKSGATYYIKNMATRSIYIKTSVDFAGASFIIDDTEVSKINGDGIADWDIFYVKPDNDNFKLDSKNEYIKKLNEKDVAIDRETVTKLDLGLGYPAMLKIENSNVRHYIRYGSNANSGQAQCEIIVIDAEGNIDETTPFLFDFEDVTAITVYRLDDKPIEITNGKFTTLATKVQDTSNKYILRGLRVSRPNTTLSNIEHYIEGEIPKGQMVNGVAFYANGYSGFFRVENTSNVEIRDSIASAHVNYGSSYDITTKYANDVRFINVKQTEENFRDGSRWWIMGSNYCKNLYYDECYLTRFDAHAGVYNATIRNSTLSSLRLIGGGDFVLEDSTIRARSYGGDTVIMLREDFGSTWRGNIYIKNVLFDSVNELAKYETVAVIYGEWVNHNFGYDTYLPNLYIDNLRFAERLGVKRVNLFAIVNKDPTDSKIKDFSLSSFSGKANENVYNPPEVVSVKNCDKGVSFVMPSGDFYKRTKMEK